MYGTGPQPPPEEAVSGYEPTMVRNVGDVTPARPRSGGVARPDAVYADEDEGKTDVTAMRRAESPVPAADAEGEAGSRKPSRPVPSVEGASARKPSRPVPSVVVDEAALEEHVARRRPMGLYAAIAVLLVVATAAITALVVGQPAAPAPVATATAPASGSGVTADTQGGAPGAAGTAGTNAVAAAAPGAAGSGTPAAGQDAGATATPGAAANGAPAVGQGAVATGTPAPGAVGSGAPAAGSGTPAKGTEVAPPAGSAPVVPAGGQGASVSSSASVATGTGGNTQSPPPAKTPGGKKRPAQGPVKPVKYVTPAKVLQIIDEKGKVYVLGGRLLGLAPGTVVEVVGALKSGKRELLGKATVLEPAGKQSPPRRIQLRLDAEALTAEGDLFIAVPDASLASVVKGEEGEGRASETADVPATKEPEKELYGSARLSGGIAGFGNDEVTVHNLGTTDWTNCYVVKGPRNVAWLGALKSNEKRSVSRFKHNANYDVPSGMLGVLCKEGKFVTRAN
jgi:hypothetical protein